METYEEKYKDLVKRLNKAREEKRVYTFNSVLDAVAPELKIEESEDEKIKQELIEYHKIQAFLDGKPNNKHVKFVAWLEKQGEPQDKGEISDGYHTFNELYFYRMLYNAAFFNMLPKEWVHKSKKHHDGKDCFGGGWFIVMANLPTGQISNHYELKDWDLFQIPEKEVADKWDGHTPQEAADRLHKYLLEKQSEQKSLDDVAKEVTKDKDAAISFLKSCGIMNENGELADEYKIEQGEQKPAKNIVETWKDMRLEVYQQASGNRHEPNYSDDTTKMFSLSDIDEIIEKMSEQKPAKVEPKFKVGDKVKSVIDGFECTIESIDNTCYYGDTTNFDIQDQDGWELVEQKPAEWSEEDEYLLDETIKHLESLIRITKKQGSAYSDEIQYYQRDIDWLKSLRPQNYWKPSEEQMDALYTYIYNPQYFNSPDPRMELVESVYKDLKKLREE